MAAGGLVECGLAFRLPFLFDLGFAGGGGGGGSSELAAFQVPMGMVVFRVCSASGASHSELCGDGMLSDESRF